MSKKEFKYGMGIALQTTKVHPPYHYTRGVEGNLRIGLEYAKEHRFRQPYLKVAKELNELANINEHRNPEVSEVYRKAAKKAFKLHDEKERKLVRV